ncbi:MAG TPA: hypothetical protein PLP33_27675 [Leptospiraceae bacterium]|nr:hypothetical protein [Leptospiraceae bacterium]
MRKITTARIKNIVLVILFLTLIITSDFAFQGNYKIFWLTKTGATRECGSCMFKTREEARKTAERVNRETGNPQTFAIRGCEN